MKVNNLLLNPDISPDGVPSGGEILMLPPEKSNTEVEVVEPPTNPTLEDAPEEGEPFSMDAFNALKKPPEEVVKPKPEDKIEDRVEDKPVVDDKKVDIKPDTTKLAPQDKKVTARDYSDIPAEDVDVFKKMGNEAFAKFKPIYLAEKAKTKLLEEKEVALTEARKTGLPDNYFENPEAYIFDPEYKQANQALGIVNAVTNHWREQMKAVESGKEWIDLTYDNTTGKFVKSAPQPSNADNRIAVQEAFQNVLNQQSSWSGKVEHIKSTHLQRSQEVTNDLNAAADAWFPSFKDEKSEHHLVARDIESKLPASIRRSPLAKIITRSLAVNTMLTKRVGELTKLIPTKPAKDEKVITDSKRRAGPTAGDMGASTGATQENGGEEVTYEDFKRLKEGY